MIVLVALTERAPPLAAGSRVVDVNGLCAVVAEVASAPASDLSALREHDARVRAVHDAVDAVLPVRFGEVHADEGALQDALRPRVDELLAKLIHVRGRAQMTLRVARGEEADVVDDKSSGTAYLQRKARALQVPELDPLRAALGSLVVDERVEPAAAPLLASVLHLIPRESAAAYVDVVHATTLRVRVKVTGPFPCWAFT